MEQPKIDQIAKYTDSRSSITLSGDHQLWVNLSALGEGNVFTTLWPTVTTQIYFNWTQLINYFVPIWILLYMKSDNKIDVSLLSFYNIGLGLLV